MNRYLALTVWMLLIFCGCRNNPAAYISNEGFIYGTVYHITYESPSGKDFQKDMDAELRRLDVSLSTFNKESVLSKINHNESVSPDDHFRKVFQKSMEISELSGGAFDPTVAPLVNAWGFGFTRKESVTPALIDSILEFVGYQKIRIENDRVVKDDSRIMLDFSAIAKGYTVDQAGLLLENKGCKNYMVEIGGEVRAKGLNPNGVPWRIGINEPNDEEPLTPDHLQAIVSLTGKALATSGNYRNFYVENGKKYAHTIDPFTGYPVDHSLLSATVLANDCMTADALATACMVKGVEKAMEMAAHTQDIDFFLIYADSLGEHQVIYTDGFNRYLTE
ncbi:MAG TPA: FAD:protein FMN transferase [Prolixibacteraceae bacterium]|nr:FAD:protein FMN transferase [Prolixibacteraceae bacterium]